MLSLISRGRATSLPSWLTTPVEAQRWRKGALREEMGSPGRTPRRRSAEIPVQPRKASAAVRAYYAFIGAGSGSLR
jgi:hypothetical protein